MADPLIHFWCTDELATETQLWDPDAEPQRHATGVGHVLLELYVRLRDAGANVELGNAATRRPDLVVVAAGSVRKHPASLESALSAIARARGRFVLVRSDTPLSWHFPLEPTCELMPYRGLVAAPNQSWLPPLPQRGLRARRGGTIERIETVTIKCNPVTLPEPLRDGRIAEALAAAGARLWIDMPEQTDGSDQSWHDFSTVDAVLCARAAGVGEDWTAAKPATKLINAWVAGCIPIASREPAYVELARDGEDARFVNDVDQLPTVVSELNGDPAALRRLQAGVLRRLEEFRPERVVRLWRDLLEDVAGTTPAAPLRGVRARATAARLHGARRRDYVGLALRRRVRRRRPGGTS